MSSLTWKFYLAGRALLGLAAVPMNCVTLICVFSYLYLRTGTDNMLASVALCDLLNGAFKSILCVIRITATDWFTRHVLCVALHYFQALPIFLENISFTVLALERLNSLLHQMGVSRKWSEELMLKLLVFAYAGLFIYVTAVVSIYAPGHENGTGCYLANFLPIWYLSGGTAFLICCVFIWVIVYGKLIFAVYKSRSQIAASSAIQQGIRANDLRVSKMVGITIGTYILLYAPWLACLFTIKVQDATWWQTVIYHASILIFDLNAIVNPFIYACRSKKYAKAYRQSWRKIKRVLANQDSSGMENQS